MTYNCKSCGRPAKKPALTRNPEWHNHEKAKLGPGLGHWRCANCGAAKVQRSKD